jgi:hypothetical protein
MTVKYCKNCNWSYPEVGSEWNLKCNNPEVNKNNAYALASNDDISGTYCREERAKYWPSPCGKRGAQYSEVQFPEGD